MEEPREKVAPTTQEHDGGDALDPEALVGVTLGGRYEVKAPLGKGGMGVVYLASQSALNREVVVKVLGRGLSGEGEAMQRFEREALGLSQLMHPNIVTIYDFGRDLDQAYIVMEYVDGDMLGELMARVGRMSFELFAPVAAQILAALAEAHTRGIIHRDIKPSNIMLCERHGSPNFVKVLDFGLVKLVGDAQEVTKKQNLVGSVAFLAPEQILGLEFDQRADVYALGVLFYYMLCGTKPFVGEDDIAILYQHIHKDATPLREVLPPDHDIPEPLIELVHRCLSKEPQDRPVDARELLELMNEMDTRATFALPWSSGEFAAVSRSQVMTLPTSSGPHQGVAVVELTPVSQRQIPALGQDSSGRYEPISEASLERESLSEVSEVPVVAPAPSSSVPLESMPAAESSSKKALLGGLALLLFVMISGAGALMFMNQSGDKKGAEAAASQGEEPFVEREQELLGEVDKLLEESRWGQAEGLLATLKQRSSNTAILRRVAEHEDTIAVGRLLHKARLAEENQERERAREHYQAILERIPSHQFAQQKLDEFAAEDREQQGKMGKLTVSTVPASTVFLDDMELGKTPIDVELEAGAYKVRLEAQGHRGVTRDLKLDPGGAQRVDVTLEPLKTKTSTKKAKPTSKPSETQKKPATTQDLLIPVEQPKQNKLNTENGLLPVGN